MTVERFFELFLLELKSNSKLRTYYRFLNNMSRFEFRKAYFQQRLQYIIDNIPDKSVDVWDCGCGYGTTGLFLAMNGIKSQGTTLEFYHKEIAERLNFWTQYGDTSLFSYSYENLFDALPADASKDLVILQDTLHHLEPLEKAVQILNRVLRKEGKLIVVEENGNNIIQNLKLFLRRGNKKIIEVYDEKLQKKFLLGNENIRSLKQWKSELSKESFIVNDSKTEYIRVFPPFLFNNQNTESIVGKEQIISKTKPFLKEYFFFGINFIAEKSN